MRISQIKQKKYQTPTPLFHGREEMAGAGYHKKVTDALPNVAYDGHI